MIDNPPLESLELFGRDIDKIVLESDKAIIGQTDQTELNPFGDTGGRMIHQTDIKAGDGSVAPIEQIKTDSGDIGVFRENLNRRD